jgi:hypothetical protein
MTRNHMHVRVPMHLPMVLTMPPMAFCSPIVGKGSLVPTPLVIVLLGEMVDAPAGCLRIMGRQRHLGVGGRALIGLV